MEPLWRVELLGGLQVCRGEQTVSRFRTRKVADLLAYLAYFRQRSHPREVLIELLWPEADLDAGRHNLSMALTFLRQLLEPPGVADGAVVVADRRAATLNPLAVTTDVAEFETALKAAAGSTAEERGRHLTAAVELYGGELLPGHYDDWIFPEQQRLDELYFGALSQLTRHLEREADPERALQFALRAVASNRLREEAHREVMRLYAAAGRPADAMRQYRDLERMLKEELDTVPGRETQIIAHSLRATDTPSPPRSVPAPTPRPRPSAEPAQRSDTSPETIASPRSEQLEPVGGAVPLGSKFYVERPADREFREAVARRDSIVLVKGPRQVGKTSLLARGLQHARESGAQVVLTHFQTLSAADFDSSDALLMALGETLAEQLDLETRPAEAWDPHRSPNLNFRRYLRREVLGTVAQRTSAPLVWGLEEVDRLFSCSFGSEIFGLFRSWHDERALEPGGPWSALTLAIAYSTEAHLFITDMNQSPFNVGTRMSLEDFTLEQVADLNNRYGAPLAEESELTGFYALLEGHPYLVRRGLHEMVAHATAFSVLESRADSDDWIFGEHLRRMLVLLVRDPELCDAARAMLQGRSCPSEQAFYRMRSAGLLSGHSSQDARFRCQLYAAYLRQHLGPSPG